MSLCDNVIIIDTYVDMCVWCARVCVCVYMDTPVCVCVCVYIQDRYAYGVNNIVHV